MIGHMKSNWMKVDLNCKNKIRLKQKSSMKEKQENEILNNLM